MVYLRLQLLHITTHKYHLRTNKHRTLNSARECRDIDNGYAHRAISPVSDFILGGITEQIAHNSLSVSERSLVRTLHKICNAEQHTKINESVIRTRIQQENETV